MQQGWELARRWYGDRLSANWRPFNAQQAQGIFAEMGLRGEFWSLS